MIATTRIYLVSSSQGACGSVTLGLARKIQECSRCPDTACRYPAHNVTRINVHIGTSSFSGLPQSPVTSDEVLIRFIGFSIRDEEFRAGSGTDA